MPPDSEGGALAVRIDELPGDIALLQVGRVLATGLHQVDSPAFDARGRLYVTQSGARDSKSPIPLYRVTADGAREPLSIDVGNPTSMALGPDGCMYVSSRFDGQVHRLTADDHVELYVTEVGVPTGLAFAPDGTLFIGDRSGSILRVSPDRQVETFASLPPSVAAFHLAYGPDDCLYVTAPTLSTHDPLYRISPGRLVDVVCQDFGRPQGLAFDSSGALFVVDAVAGGAGLYRVDVTAILDPYRCACCRRWLSSAWRSIRRVGWCSRRMTRSGSWTSASGRCAARHRTSRLALERRTP